MSREWRQLKKQLSPELIRLISELKASDIKQHIGDSPDTDTLTDAECDFTKIQNLEIPEKFTFEFWRYINMIGDYWAYRYDFNLPENSIYQKSRIRLAIAIARIYGLAGIDKSTGIPYFIHVENGEWKGIKITDMYDDKDFMSYDKSSNQLKINENYKKEELWKKFSSREDFALLKCRRVGIGDLVWFMIPLLEYIQSDKILKVNLMMLKNMLFYNVYDKELANNEIADMLDTFKPIIKLVGSKKIKKDVLGAFNNVSQESFTKDAHLEKIIAVSKHEFENLLFWMGIPITSSKNQSLSSDLSLSVSTNNIFAKSFDEPVEEFLKELGINNVEIPDTDIYVENQNSDKQGMGKSNTEGTINQEKAEQGE